MYVKDAYSSQKNKFYTLTIITMEEWRNVPWYEWLYGVSSLWRVKSLARVAKSWMYGNQTKKEKLLKPFFDGRHNRVCLMKDGKRSYVFVHRLMAMAFLWCSEKFDGKTLVCHKNDIGTDNRLENLYVGTYGTNNSDTVRNWHGVDNSNENHWMCRLTNKQILEIRDLVKKWLAQSKIAKMYGIDQSYVSRLKNDLNRRVIA